jgi:hypothetical protein
LRFYAPQALAAARDVKGSAYGLTREILEAALAPAPSSAAERQADESGE